MRISIRKRRERSSMLKQRRKLKRSKRVQPQHERQLVILDSNLVWTLIVNKQSFKLIAKLLTPAQPKYEVTSCNSAEITAFESQLQHDDALKLNKLSKRLIETACSHSPPIDGVRCILDFLRENTHVYATSSDQALDLVKRELVNQRVIFLNGHEAYIQDLNEMVIVDFHSVWALFGDRLRNSIAMTSPKFAVTSCTFAEIDVLKALLPPVIALKFNEWLTRLVKIECCHHRSQLVNGLRCTIDYLKENSHVYATSTDWALLMVKLELVYQLVIYFKRGEVYQIREELALDEQPEKADEQTKMVLMDAQLAKDLTLNNHTVDIISKCLSPVPALYQVTLCTAMGLFDVKKELGMPLEFSLNKHTMFECSHIERSCYKPFETGCLESQRCIYEVLKRPENKFIYATSTISALDAIKKELPNQVVIYYSFLGKEAFVVMNLDYAYW